MTQTPDNQPGTSPMRTGDLGRYAGLGFQFAAVMALFAGAGWWLDGKLGTEPWLLVCGCLLGAVGATIALVRAVPPPRPAKRPPGS